MANDAQQPPVSDTDETQMPKAFEDPRIVDRVEDAFATAEDHLDLPADAMAEARSILLDAVNNELIDKRGYETAVGAAVFLGCRLTSTPRTPDEIAAALDIDKNTLMAVGRKFRAKLDVTVEPYNPMTFLERYIEEFDPSQETVNKAFDLLMVAKDQDLTTGRSPSGVAAGALYAAARLTDESISQPDLAAVSDVSEPTIRSNYRAQLDASQMDAEEA